MKETPEIIDFAGKDNVKPDFKVLPIDYVNTAMEHLAKADLLFCCEGIDKAVIKVHSKCRTLRLVNYESDFTFHRQLTCEMTKATSQQKRSEREREHAHPYNWEWVLSRTSGGRRGAVRCGEVRARADVTPDNSTQSSPL
ncbi:Uncharacterized protein TCM_000955 [Theobroma cacao]|uniref:Uncharacterized protein n=1 Tax=Theobroma cacao TaxID=3641 RepID=A0A061DIZ9_THECC|nr:Uncharacterized protein TCM_000955 [Theobroma cacao]